MVKATLSFNPYIDGLTGPGVTVGPINATYSFAEVRAQIFNYLLFTNDPFHKFTPDQEKNFRLALEQYATVAQIKWTEVDVSVPACNLSTPRGSMISPR